MTSIASIAVLDTCVLVPSRLRDLLLRTAAINAFHARWSEETLTELERTHIHHQIAQRGSDTAIKGRIGRLLVSMQEVFPRATVHRRVYNRHLSALQDATNDPDDRHVVAAAVSSRASIIVTENLRDFREEALAALGIRLTSADTFMTELFEHQPTAVLRVVEQQQKGYRHPPLSMDELLNRLAVNVPNFVVRVRDSGRLPLEPLQ